jgi:hypothetical protein
MKKSVALLIVSFFALPSLAMATANDDCYTTFYQSKNMECVDGFLKNLRKSAENHANQGVSDNQAGVGFLAEIFSTYPQEKEHILKQDASSDDIKSVYIEALYRAGLQEEAKKYADANGFSAAFKQYQDQGGAPIKSLKPHSTPADNDLLIGAYMASGHTQYIRNILENFVTAEDAQVSDAFRMSLMQAKFGPTLVPPDRPTTTVATACQKYACKANMQKLMRVMTLSSGVWAVQSLAQHDDGIKKTFVDFFEGDKRLKRLFETEENAFANYMTMLAAHAGGISNPNIESSLSIYEKLGSPKDAQDAFVRGLSGNPKK